MDWIPHEASQVAGRVVCETTCEKAARRGTLSAANFHWRPGCRERRRRQCVCLERPLPHQGGVAVSRCRWKTAVPSKNAWVLDSARRAEVRRAEQMSDAVQHMSRTGRCRNWLVLISGHFSAFEAHNLRQRRHGSIFRHFGALLGRPWSGSGARRETAGALLLVWPRLSHLHSR